jgi:N-acetylated-alpha-linked acidic dipeptidase
MMTGGDNHHSTVDYNVGGNLEAPDDHQLDEVCAPIEMQPIVATIDDNSSIASEQQLEQKYRPKPLASRVCFAVLWRSETQAATVSGMLTTIMFLVIFMGKDFSGEGRHRSCDEGSSDNASLFSQEYIKAHRAVFRNATSSNNIYRWAQEFSSIPHLAGSARNAELAQRTAQLFADFGLEVRTQTFPTVLSNTTKRRLRKVNITSNTLLNDLDLDEVNLKGQQGWDTALPASNGFSGSGLVRAALVWVNYGRQEDFDAIIGLNLTGTIVIVRYGKIFRGDKVKLAAQRGAAGVIITHDPADMVQGPMYPDGPWANNATVQRGSVALTEGDVVTPTWPAEFGGPTISTDDLFNDNVMGKGFTLPNIPVLPIGFGNARRILPGIGNGITSRHLPAHWRDTGFLDLLGGGIGPGEAVVELEVRRALQQYNVTNVFGVLTGELEPEKAVIMGSHRDAWTYGAGDAISGHATMLEVARALGSMARDATSRWRPRRTLQFCSWDAEEWSIVGSVEYVETNSELLRQRAVAYLNMDIAVSGSEMLSLSGSPLLESVAMLAASEVLLPNSTLPLSSMVAPFTAPGSGSDHVGFIQVAGVPVIDSTFENRTSSYEAVYHSNYDSLDWMSRFGDPGYFFHRTMAQFQGTMMLFLADSAVLPMHVEVYAARVSSWVGHFVNDPNNGFADFSFMIESVRLLSAACAIGRDRREAAIQQESQIDAIVSVSRAIDRVNRVAYGMERVFVGRGADDSGQTWYLHVIFTPSAVDFYSAATMPLIADALRTKNATLANFAIGRVAQFIRRAATFVNETSVASPWYTNV